ncbi:cAMP-regulated phosphoprotein 19 [Lingula anatina]|uniref:cAMP-regulated phosphoprotein 19 n=1 Tax=Lingula anatina TaxID=7574 RepID=A0A1S3IYP1_LINAN|nr:cAMP-regulated phosphoprotein 19 [Lingula anatina]|eukprot:XP_013403101.1 cAMP-regulated phosphoprotein 19 [Lingula anatina]
MEPSAEVRSSTVSSDSSQESGQTLMQIEEAKLKAKYPNMKAGRGGASALLQKRLHKAKYFDSGDYNMAKAIVNKKKVLAPQQAEETKQALLQEVTGDEIPTPDSVPHRKSSLVQSKLVSTS